MRISDWSSDVCSSDLCSCLNGRYVAADQLATEVRQLAARGKTDALAWTRVVPGAVTAGALAMRSEEHTSELQSLMRISYAVFCLKKKKARRTNVSKGELHHE